MTFPFLKDGFNILGCPVRFLVAGGSGERYRGKAQDFQERGLVWFFCFQFSTARITFYLSLQNENKNKPYQKKVKGGSRGESRRVIDQKGRGEGQQAGATGGCAES